MSPFRPCSYLSHEDDSVASSNGVSVHDIHVQRGRPTQRDERAATSSTTERVAENTPPGDDVITTTLVDIAMAKAAEDNVVTAAAVDDGVASTLIVYTPLAWTQ
jgi:hypothetical protein